MTLPPAHEALHPEKPQPLLLTLDEVAEHLRCTRRHVENLISRDHLKAVHLGRAVRVRRRDLDALIEGGTT